MIYAHRMADFPAQFDWNLLHTFLVVVQERSMTRAAQKLHRTQPAISQAIRRLEDATGTSLLRRDRDGLVPTAAGRILLDQARSVYATVSRIPVALEGVSRDVTGRIHIATVDSVVSDTLDRLLRGFFERHPAVDLEIEVSTTASIIRAVERGTCTFGITGGTIPEHLDPRLLINETYGLYCGARHALAGRAEVSPNELRRHPFIGFPADVLGGPHMNEVTAFRARMGISQRVRGQSSIVNEVRRMIECGLGIGLLPVHLAAPSVAAGSLWRLPPREDCPEAPIWLVTNPAIELSPAETALLARLTEGADT